MSQSRVNLAFCIFLTIIVGLLLIMLSRQPIHVNITAEEIIGRLCDAEKESNNKENAVVGKIEEY